MLANDNNGRIYLQLRDVLGDRHGVNPIALHDSAAKVTQSAREDTVRLMLRGISHGLSDTEEDDDAPGEADSDGARGQPEGAEGESHSGEEEDAEGEDDELKDVDENDEGEPLTDNNSGENMEPSSTRANPSESRRPGGTSNTNVNRAALAPASSPFAPAATPTPAGGSRSSTATNTATKKQTKKAAGPEANTPAPPPGPGRTAPAARKTNNASATAYDKSVAAASAIGPNSNAPTSSTGRSRAKGKEKEEVGVGIRDGFSTYRETVREHDVKKEERLSKKQKILDSRLELEKQRDKREADRHKLEMESQARVLAELERQRYAGQVKEFLIGIDDLDLGMELSGQLAFGPRWDSVRESMEKIIASREQARRKADQRVVDEGTESLDKNKES